MKSRIMEYLHQLATGKNCPVLNDLLLETGLPEDKIREHAALALANILHHYPMFSVKTIDSFFQNIVQAFAKEIGLQGGFEIELDQEVVLDNLVDRVMLDVGTNKQLTKWLIRFSENRVTEGKSWDIKEDIKRLAWEIFNENFKTFEQEIHQNSHIVPELLTAMNKVINDFESGLKSLGKEAVQLMRAAGLEVHDFSYSSNGVMGYLEKLSRGQTKAPSGRFLGTCDQPDKLYKKNDPKESRIVDLYYNGLQQIICRVTEMFEEDILHYTTAKALSRYIYTLGILSDVSLKLNDYREENQTLLISDLADFLKKIIQENDAPFIYEKSGTRFKYYMIDEFQDTSGFQWDNFKPLITNSLAEGHLNLAVGDVKQSIYRWRGGNWELLLQQLQQDIHPEMTEKLNLDTNFRSRKMLIRFFNSLFAIAPEIIQIHLAGSIPEVETTVKQEILPAIEKIKLAYSDALQVIPASELNIEDQGFVKAEFYESNQEESWQQQILNRLPSLLENLQDAHYALDDVAFLVRNKDEGEKIIRFLMDHQASDNAREGYRYDAISSESLYLSVAHSVKVLLNAFEYLDHPENEIAFFNLVYEYQVFILANKEYLHPDIITQSKEQSFVNSQQLLPADFLIQKSLLVALPLYELAEALVRMFGLQKMQGEWPFLQAFLDLIVAYAQKERGEVKGFLEWWQKTGKTCSIQMPDNMDAAKVLTIHKSKGLQFKVVIIPFCNWNLEHNPVFDNIIWCEADQPPFNSVKRMPVKYGTVLKDTLFRKQYYEEKVRSAIDNLNLLYVAVTRAREQLYISGCAPSTKTNGENSFKTVSDLLFTSFNQLQLPPARANYQFLDFSQYWDPAKAVFEAGIIDKKPSVNAHKEPEEPLTKFISEDWRNRIAVKFSSHALVDESGDRAQKIRYGKLVHYLLSKVDTYQDVPKVIREFYYEGTINSEEMKILEEKLATLFTDTQIKEWFSGKYQIKTEAPVILPDGTTMRPDRILVTGDKAIAIDFKTGQKKPSDLKQVEAYKILLTRMGYKRVEGYLLYLDDITYLKVEEI